MNKHANHSDLIDAFRTVNTMEGLAELLKGGVADDVIHRIGHRNVANYIEVNGTSTLAVQFDDSPYAEGKVAVLCDDGFLLTYDRYEMDCFDDDTIRAIVDNIGESVRKDYRIAFPGGSNDYHNDCDAVLYALNDWLADQDGEITEFPTVTNALGEHIFIDYHCAFATETAVVRNLAPAADDDDGDIEYLYEVDATCYRYVAKLHSRDARCMFTNDDQCDDAAGKAFAFAYSWLINHNYRDTGDDVWTRGSQKVSVEVIETIASTEPPHSAWITLA